MVKGFSNNLFNIIDLFLYSSISFLPYLCVQKFLHSWSYHSFHFFVGSFLPIFVLLHIVCCDFLLIYLLSALNLSVFCSTLYFLLSFKPRILSKLSNSPYPRCLRLYVFLYILLFYISLW